MGIGHAFIITSVNSITIINFSDQSDDILGLASIANGFGVILGPLFGSLLFNWWSFKGVYLGFSTIFAVWAVIFMVLIPN
jgi:fucose permease